MTTRRDISLNVIADISKYQQQFAQIPGYTDKQAAKAAQALEKRMSKAAANTAKQAERAAEKAGRAAAKAADESQRAAIEAGKGLVELAGIPADKFEKFRAVLGGLASPMGQLAVAATGAALAIGGVVVAMAGAATASVAAVRASDELLTKFEKLSTVEGFAIPETDVESIRQANAALDAVQSSAERLVVLFAGDVAPSVQAVALEVVKLGLLAGDVFNSMGGGVGIVAEAFNTMGRTLVDAISAPAGALLRFADVSAEIARAAGFTDLAERFDSIADSVGGIPFAAVEVGFEGIEFATSNYQERAEQLLGVQRQLADAERETKTATDAATKSSNEAADAAKRQADQIRALIEAGKKRNEQVDRDLALRAQNAKLVEQATAVELSAMGRLAQATDTQLAKAEEIRAQRLENARGDNFLRLQAEEEFQAAQLAIIEEYEMARTELSDEEAAKRKAIAEAEVEALGEGLVKFLQTTLGAMDSLLSDLGTLAADSRNKEQARALFNATKVTGAAVTLVNTYVAAQKAIAELGPIAGPVAATALTAAGLTRVAVIKRQQMPAFYRGTSMVQRVDGGAGDAVPSVLHEGEAVLNRRAADTIGRRQIDALNAGSSSSPPMVVAVSQINHRQFRSFYRDDRQLPGSLTRGDRNRSGSRIGRQL
jgi:hypothetical protein